MAQVGEAMWGWGSGVQTMFDPGIFAAPASSSMRVAAQFQEFHSRDLKAEQHEVVGHGRAIGDGWSKGRFVVKRSARRRPSPQGSAFGSQLLPVVKAALPHHACVKLALLSPETKLATGLWQQPAHRMSGVVLQFRHLGTALIGQQLKGVVVEPASKHKGADPWASVFRDAGELQPSAHRGAAFPLARCLQEWSPGGKVFRIVAH